MPGSANAPVFVERHIARDDQFPSTLGVEASIKALTVANLRPTDLDLIICSTSSPEYIFPATACLIQDQLGATKAGAFDLLAACSGFIYALNMGAQAIRSGSIKSALIIGSETLSRFVNWKDRNTCILFGDGAGAFVLQASDQPGGVLSAVMHSDGSGGDLLTIEGGGSRYPATEATHPRRQTLHSNGWQGSLPLCDTCDGFGHAGSPGCRGIESSKICSWIIPHQANIRIIEAAARGLKLPMDRFIVNLERYGNTSTASIPMAMVEAVEKGQIKPGENCDGGFWRWADVGRPRRGMDRPDPKQGTCSPGTISPVCTVALVGTPCPPLYRRPAVSP